MSYQEDVERFGAEAINAADEALAQIGKLDLHTDTGWSAARAVILNLVASNAKSDEIRARFCSNSWHRTRATTTITCSTCKTSVKF